MSADEKLAAVRQDHNAMPATFGRPSGAAGLGGRLGGGLGRISSGEWKILIAVLLVACSIRLFRISKPNSVVFDEVHFGKFAGKYIRTRYYVDVHPPLAKLLLTLAAWIGGFTGEFDFKEIGMAYPDSVPYVLMRMVPAVLGVLLVPITYLTLRALDCSASTSLLGSILIIFENGLVTQSRHILLDSPLLFFTGLSVMFWVMFCNEDKRPQHKAPTVHGAKGVVISGPFSRIWWTYLLLTGLSLGAVVSCKWVGLFTIATIGASTIKQLWALLGDLHIPASLWMRHFIARAICLIAVPLLFYMAMFEIHFSILRNSGDGDAFMSSEFQHTLQGKEMHDTYADVAIGSTVTIRHVNTQGGYLHSHPHNYPGGSKQQQITLYPHIDSNNDWLIVPALDPSHSNTTDPMKTLTYLKPGSVVRFRHIKTGKHLHSHDVRPPVSEVDFQQEVSGYGFEGFEGDANDNFIIELDEEGGGDDGGRKGNGRGWGGDRESGRRVRTLRSILKFRHQLTGCYLFSHKVKLPDWAYEQQEVTCNKNAVRMNSLWYIETNENPLLPVDAEKVNYKLPGFFGKFLELQKVMWQTNAGLTSRHAYDSRPHHWPFLRRGINFWVQNHRHIYLIGNPFTWWLSSISVLLYIGVRGLLVLREKRGYKDFHHSAVVKYDQLIGFTVLGWALHYLPFFLMGRQLFLHHYFPALYFSILTFASVFDLVTSTMSPRRRIQVAAVIMALSIWTFAHFSPLAYGNPWTKKHCMSAKWLKTWDFSCYDYHDDYSQYRITTSAPAGEVVHTHAIPASPSAAGVNPAVKPVENLPEPEVLTKAIQKEKLEPGRDVFEAQPIDDLNERLKANLAMTGANAPVDPKEKEKLKELEKSKAEASKNAQKEAEELEGKVGPLLPSELAKVGERVEKKVSSADTKVEEHIEEKPLGKIGEKSEAGSVDPTTVQSVEKKEATDKPE